MDSATESVIINKICELVSSGFYYSIVNDYRKGVGFSSGSVQCISHCERVISLPGKISAQSTDKWYKALIRGGYVRAGANELGELWVSAIHPPVPIIAMIDDNVPSFTHEPIRIGDTPPATPPAVPATKKPPVPFATPPGVRMPVPHGTPPEVSMKKHPVPFATPPIVPLKKHPVPSNPSNLFSPPKKTYVG